HNLADGENEIEVPLCDEPVDLCRPRVVQLALRLLVDEFSGNFAESFDIGSPVMHTKKILRDFAKHSRDLLRLHGGMGAEGRKNRLKPVAVVLPRIASQIARAGVHAAVVGWHDHHTVAIPQLRKTLRKQVLQLRNEIAFEIPGSAVEAHAAS